jgi:Pyridine nucleotide-disulphide oxidoreductase
MIPEIAKETKMTNHLPIAIIGAGPIGLAAAAQAIARGIPARVYEAGATVGANLRDWGHVRVFTPWELNIDAAARALLEKHGWRAPPMHELPTGEDLYARYLKALAETPELAEVIELRARVEAISREGADKVVSKGRETRPFLLRVARPDGSWRDELARAVIDASGTWDNPNPIGASGLPVPGERDNADRIAYGMPDVLGRDRAKHAGRRTIVMGAGYSAANVLIDLVQLARAEPGTDITWVARGTDLTRVYGGGRADQLPARGELGWLLKSLVERGAVTLVRGFAATAVRRERDALVLDGLTSGGPAQVGPVDRIVVATGQRPDLAMTRELRLELDPWLESVRSLGPLIDPNLHSCGDVPPHGHRELGHPEPGFYTIGVKSYGRAPTFLLLTGYEQARSVVAAIAGDTKAADEVQLKLPETGICKVTITEEAASGSCCAPSPAKATSCSGPVKQKVAATA